MTDSMGKWLFAQSTYDLRPALVEWLTANHLDPARMPHDATITVNEHTRTITSDVFVHGPDGKPMLDAAARNTVARMSVTVPLLVFPPAEIAHRLGFADVSATGRRP
jgi:hypothetical protein